jgi:hypothetical protein
MRQLRCRARASRGRARRPRVATRRRRRLTNGLSWDRVVGPRANEVRRFGGHVDEYAGDALLALFGAPVSHEHDAVLAVHAVLAMRRLVDESLSGRPDAAAVTLHRG